MHKHHGTEGFINIRRISARENRCNRYYIARRKNSKVTIWLIRIFSNEKRFWTNLSISGKKHNLYVQYYCHMIFQAKFDTVFFVASSFLFTATSDDITSKVLYECHGIHKQSNQGHSQCKHHNGYNYTCVQLQAVCYLKQWSFRYVKQIPNPYNQPTRISSSYYVCRISVPFTASNIQ